jgi:hypothetical protein
MVLTENELRRLELSQPDGGQSTRMSRIGWLMLGIGVGILLASAALGAVMLMKMIE